jgi:ABC-type Mn2+/Zn2+ transport system permease subunit
LTCAASDLVEVVPAGILSCGDPSPLTQNVVLRGMAFLGDAMSHGLLPGVALAALFGGNLLLGALLSAAIMTVGVTALSRTPRLSQDTGISDCCSWECCRSVSSSCRGRSPSRST